MNLLKWMSRNMIRFEDDDGGAGGGGGGGSDDDSGGGGDDLGYRSGIKGELRDHEYLKGFGNVTELSQSAVDNHTELTKLKDSLDGRILKPGEDATEDEISEYHKALGRPDDSQGYELDKVQVPESLKDMINPDGLGVWADKFHKLGFTPAQGQSLFAEYLNDVEAANTAKAEKAEEARKERREKGIEVLTKAWDDKVEGNTERAKRAFEKVIALTPFSPEEHKAMMDSGIGESPMIVAIFHEIATRMADDEFIRDSDTGDVDKDTRKFDDSGKAILEYKK